MILVLNILLASSVARISKDSKEMVVSGSGNGSNSGSRKELNAAILILVMASLPLLIYIPNALCFFPFILSSLFPNWNVQVTMLIAVLSRITLTLTIVVHFWNLFFYSFRVSGFLQELVRILTCGLNKLARNASQRSASTASIATKM